MSDIKTVCPVCNGSGEVLISVSSIADRRIKLRLSRYALAKLSGITNVTIRNIEVGATRPRPSTLEALNQALDKLEIERD